MKLFNFGSPKVSAEKEEKPLSIEEALRSAETAARKQGQGTLRGFWNELTGNWYDPAKVRSLLGPKVSMSDFMKLDKDEREGIYSMDPKDRSQIISARNFYKGFTAEKLKPVYEISKSESEYYQQLPAVLQKEFDKINYKVQQSLLHLPDYLEFVQGARKAIEENNKPVAPVKPQKPEPSPTSSREARKKKLSKIGETGEEESVTPDDFFAGDLAIAKLQGISKEQRAELIALADENLDRVEEFGQKAMNNLDFFTELFDGDHEGFYNFTIKILGHDSKDAQIELKNLLHQKNVPESVSTALIHGFFDSRKSEMNDAVQRYVIKLGYSPENKNWKKDLKPAQLEEVEKLRKDKLDAIKDEMDDLASPELISAAIAQDKRKAA